MRFPGSGAVLCTGLFLPRETGGSERMFALLEEHSVAGAGLCAKRCSWQPALLTRC